MKMTKKWAGLSMAVVMGLSITACGGNKDASEPSATTANSPSATASSQPVKLRIVWWGSQERHDATQKALALYTQKHPNVTFESEFSGWDGYFDKLGVQAAARNAPDVIQMDAAYLSEYIGRNLLADLSSVKQDDLDKALLESSKLNGKIYAIPLGSTAFGMGYDKTVVEKLGLKAPQFGWTWDDYYKFGEEAKAKLGKDKYVFVDQSTDLYDYTAYQLSKGKGQVFTEGKLTIDKDTWIGYMKKQSEMRKAGIVTPADMTSMDKELDPKLDSVVNGNAVMRHLFSNQVGAIDGLKPGTMEYTSLPKDAQGGGWLKPSMFWSVNADSKQKDEAIKFVDWFVNDLEAAKVLGLSRGIPVNKKVVEALSPNFNANDKKSVEFINKIAPNAQPFVAEPQGWGNFKKDYKTIVEKLTFDKSTPEQAYDELMKKAKEYESAAKK